MNFNLWIIERNLYLDMINEINGITNWKLKYICKDPKDGELYLDRIKSGETLMEVRSGSNVQIVRQIWV
jgi:hypothetical protein